MFSYGTSCNQSGIIPVSTYTAPIIPSEDQQFYIEPSTLPEFMDKLKQTNYSILRILQLGISMPVHEVLVENLSEILQGELSGLIRGSDGKFSTGTTYKRITISNMVLKTADSITQAGRFVVNMYLYRKDPNIVGKEAMQWIFLCQ
ncbi:hypothetical protein SERLA73DRAFT_157296 [Serpula lacrymans var. lacrymans S7.3]|uniref:Uncharacterized protein n=1 Tax=Serpula lacrymans var. lacrymans (strain S7.3) TaxID=936435 RepID=F8QID2_SERL3|nr:hypothetical protein SERLA73DRAFT_157296 [Serpula lacrymans var. lacrymans S7.3]